MGGLPIQREEEAMPPRKKTEPEQAPEETPAVEPEKTEPEQAPEDPTGTPVDLPHTATPVKPAEPVPAPTVYGSTFAERRAAREGKQVTSESAENKAVQK